MILIAFIIACFGGSIAFAVWSICVAAKREDELRDQLRDQFDVVRLRRVQRQ